MQTPVVFIETDFLRSFSKIFSRKINQATDWELLDFYIFMTQGIIEYNLVLNLQSKDELDKLYHELPLIRVFQKKVRKFFFISDFKKALETNFKEKHALQSPFSLFLVDWNNNTCENYESKTGFLFFNIGKLKDSWNTYSYYHVEREKYLTYGHKNSSSNFKNWESIFFIKQPINSILLLDLYLFQDKETINNNFPNLALTVIQNKCVSNFYFLCLCSDSAYDGKGKPRHRPIKSIFDDASDSIVKYSKRQELSEDEVNSLLQNLNIQQTSSGKVANSDVKRLHDRFLLTNNILISSPSGFTIKQGREIKNTFIRFDFIFYKDVFLRATGYVDNIQEYLSSTGLINKNYSYPPDQIDRIKNHPFFKDANRSD